MRLNSNFAYLDLDILNQHTDDIAGSRKRIREANKKCYAKKREKAMRDICRKERQNEKLI